MAKYNPSKRGLDERELEGGVGGGAGSGISGTKWSSMPSFKGNANIVDDFKKLTKDTSHLKGGAKKSTELAENRALNRMAVRAGATGAAVAGAKAATSNEPKKGAAKSDDYEDMSGDVNLDPSNPTGVSGKGMAKGGTASSRADGCATKGKTKGRFV